MPRYPSKNLTLIKNVPEKNECGFLAVVSYSTTVIYCIVPRIPRPPREVYCKDRQTKLLTVLATLHGCMSSGTHAGPERARVILQHDLSWMRTMDLKPETKAAEMRDRLVNMADNVDTKSLGYSLEG
jgi:hypothetical protein